MKLNIKHIFLIFCCLSLGKSYFSSKTRWVCSCLLLDLPIATMGQKKFLGRIIIIYMYFHNFSTEKNSSFSVWIFTSPEKFTEVVLAARPLVHEPSEVQYSAITASRFICQHTGIQTCDCNGLAMTSLVLAQMSFLAKHMYTGFYEHRSTQNKKN
jgi:hypothetical protein